MIHALINSALVTAYVLDDSCKNPNDDDQSEQPKLSFTFIGLIIRQDAKQ